MSCAASRCCATGDFQVWMSNSPGFFFSAWAAAGASASITPSAIFALVRKVPREYSDDWPARLGVCLRANGAAGAHARTGQHLDARAEGRLVAPERLQGGPAAADPARRPHGHG